MFTGPLQQLMAFSENERQQRHQEGGRSSCGDIDYGTANAAVGITMMPLIDLGAIRAEKAPARPPLGQRLLALWHALVGSRGLTHS